MLRKTRGMSYETVNGRCASMRPQRNAAENYRPATGMGQVEGASMRPQRNAAENVDSGTMRVWTSDASMRPQRNAAENKLPHQYKFAKGIRFNEAAA